MWILNRTKTAFGARLLRTWLGRPLVDLKYVTSPLLTHRTFFIHACLRALQERVDAIEEILSADTTQQRELLVRLRELVKGLPDLARGLCRMQYGKVR